MTRYYYFCNTHMTFASGCQVIAIHNGDNLEKVAKLWAKTNGYEHVFVYDMEYNLVWTYNL